MPAGALIKCSLRFTRPLSLGPGQTLSSKVLAALRIIIRFVERANRPERTIDPETALQRTKQTFSSQLSTCRQSRQRRNNTDRSAISPVTWRCAHWQANGAPVLLQRPPSPQEAQLRTVRTLRVSALTPRLSSVVPKLCARLTSRRTPRRCVHNVCHIVTWSTAKVATVVTKFWASCCCDVVVRPYWFATHVRRQVGCRCLS